MDGQLDGRLGMVGCARIKDAWVAAMPSMHDLTLMPVPPQLALLCVLCRQARGHSPCQGARAGRSRSLRSIAHAHLDMCTFARAINPRVLSVLACSR
eukprot:scaffold150571_cov35-Tisochrysis_lutea.AAC.2